jgi:hypothetical protein
MEKIITFHGKNYRAIHDAELSCQQCTFNSGSDECLEIEEIYCCTRKECVFEEVLVNKSPSISLSFDLDLSTVSLPEVFKVKSLRLSTLDDALAKGTDAFTVNIKDVPQETVEVIAQALKEEFLCRYSKV